MIDLGCWLKGFCHKNKERECGSERFMIRSEICYRTWRGILFRLLCRMLLPVVLMWCKEFWGLRCAALSSNNKVWRAILGECYSLYVDRGGGWIPLSVKFDGPPVLPHGVSGIFIGARAHIGRNVTIFQQVTIGEDSFDGFGHRAGIVGDECYIGAGAKIIGEITVGARCRIGANACVYKDLPPDSVAVSQPTRVIQKVSLANAFREE